MTGLHFYPSAAKVGLHCYIICSSAQVNNFTRKRTCSHDIASSLVECEFAVKDPGGVLWWHCRTSEIVTPWEFCRCAVVAQQRHCRDFAEANGGCQLHPFITEGTTCQREGTHCATFNLKQYLRRQCLTAVIHLDKMNLFVWSLISRKITSLKRDASMNNIKSI